jgi:hypothetical protein
MGTFYSPKIVRDSLVVHLDAANSKSYPGTGSTWFDLSNNGYNATLVNSPTYNPRGYFSFNGTTQYAYHTVVPFGTDTTYYTFEMWFKMRTLPTSEYGANGQIWGGQNGNNVVMYLNPSVSASSTLNTVYDDSRYTAATGHISNGSVSANQWVHWVTQGNPVTATISHYINGVLDKPFSAVLAGQEARTWTDPATIAYDSRWLTYSQLDVAVLKHYNRILSAAEVNQNFQAMRGRFGV